MLWLSSSLRYFLYGQATDMRCGIYSLAGLVANSLKQNPLNGDVFIFIGKRGNQIRLLQWDKDGYAMYIKRLEKGTFERPSGGKLELSAQELRLILEGIQLSSVQQRKRYQQPLSAYSRENKG
jgi:transposase